MQLEEITEILKADYPFCMGCSTLLRLTPILHIFSQT